MVVLGQFATNMHRDSFFGEHSEQEKTSAKTLNQPRANRVDNVGHGFRWPRHD